MNHAVVEAGEADFATRSESERACVLVVDDQPLNIALVKHFWAANTAFLRPSMGRKR
jgi:hypothetical protein